RCKPKAPRVTCNTCLTKKFTLAAHYAVLQPDRSLSASCFLPNLADIGGMSEASRVHSDHTFSSHFIANKMIALIRDFFARPHSSDLRLPSLRRRLMETMRAICADVREILAMEPRNLRVQSPCYVFGDLHGNL